MKSILFITYEYPTYTPFGGIAFYYQKVADILSKMGFKVTVLTCIPLEEELLKIQMENALMDIIYLRGESLYQFKIKVDMWLNNNAQGKFDLIEAPEYGAILFELIKSKQIYKFGKRVTIRVHGTTILANAYGKKQNEIQKWITKVHFYSQNQFILRTSKFLKSSIYSVSKINYREKFTVINADSVTTPSNLMTSFITKYWIKKHQKRLVTFPNPSQFVLENNNSLRYTNDYELKISYINRAQVLKGFDLFTDLSIEMGKTLESSAKLKFYCYGTFESENSERTKYIDFKGHLGSDDIKKVYQESFLIIIPSRFESFSNVALEAMSLGTLVLVSNNMGIAEHITNFENGFVFESGNFDSLKKVFSRIIGLERSEILRIRENAFETARVMAENIQLKQFYLNETKG